MRYQGQLSGQNFDFLAQRLVFIHDKQFLSFYGAKAASDLDPRNLQILFGNRNLHPFRQVFELLIQLIGFHVIKALQPLENRRLCVIISTHFIAVYHPQITRITQKKIRFI
jgi:hypothetical protein